MKKARSKTRDQEVLASKKTIRRRVGKIFTNLGHQPGPWINSPSGTAGSARLICSVCSKTITVSLTSGRVCGTRAKCI